MMGTAKKRQYTPLLIAAVLCAFCLGKEMQVSGAEIVTFCPQHLLVPEQETPRDKCPFCSRKLSRIALDPPAANWTTACTKYLLDIASDPRMARESRQFAILGLRWAGDAKETLPLLERTLKDSSWAMRAAAIRTLSTIDPPRAARLATQWVNGEKDKIFEDPQTIFDRSFPIAEVLEIAGKSAVKQLIHNWLASGSFAYEQLAFGYLCRNTELLDGELRSQVTKLKDRKGATVLVHWTLACGGDKRSAKWLKDRLRNHDVRYVLLSQWEPRPPPDPRLPLEPRLVLDASADAWKSSDVGLRLNVARFDLATGGKRGYQVLWRAVLTQSARPHAAEQGNGDYFFGELGMFVLAEYPRKESLDLAKIVFRSPAGYRYRMPAATLILKGKRTATTKWGTSLPHTMRRTETGTRTKRGHEGSRSLSR